MYPMNKKEQIVEIDGSVYCQECLSRQLALEKQEVSKLQEKYIFYKQYEAAISSNELAELKKAMGTAEENSTLNLKEKQQNESLMKLKKEEQQNIEMLQSLKQKIIDLDKKQGQFWESLNKFQKKLNRLEEKANAARWQYKSATEQYERLQRFNVLSQVFRITCQGQVGYINGMAIGKKQHNKTEMEWQEINAGLGHLFLMFCFLVIKFEYNCLRLVERQCAGSCSTAKVRNKTYQIAYSKEKQKQFGEFMDQWLLELQHLRIHIASNFTTTEKIEFRHKIVLGQYKINNQYVNPSRIKSGKWDEWTSSMRLFMTNLEYLSTVCTLSDKFI